MPYSLFKQVTGESKTMANKKQKRAPNVRQSTSPKKLAKNDAVDDDSIAEEANFRAWSTLTTEAERERFIRRVAFDKLCLDKRRSSQVTRRSTTSHPPRAPFETQNPRNHAGNPCHETGSPHHPRCISHPSELALLLYNAPRDSTHSDIYFMIENLGIAVHDIRKIEADTNDEMPVWLLDFETIADWVNFGNAWAAKGKGGDLGLPGEVDLDKAPEWHVQWRNPRLPALGFFKESRRGQRESMGSFRMGC